MPAGAAAPFFWGAIASAGGALGGAAITSHSANKSADKQTAMANQVAALEAQTAEKQLAFQKEQADLAQRNYLDTRAYNRQVYEDQQARLAPYRQFGQASLAQLSQPIPGMTNPYASA